MTLTNQQIEDLAQRYVNEVYDGDMDFYYEAINVIEFINRTHILMDRKKVVTIDYGDLTDELIKSQLGIEDITIDPETDQ